LGLGDYRVLRYQAVVRHLRLVDCAYACLTHVHKAKTNPRKCCDLNRLANSRTECVG
jgi:hypothetical protein